jgi:aminobenzoyl-glutamate transport protein
LILRSLDWVERTGNRLPQPVTLFAILVGLVLAGSAVAAWSGLHAVHPGTGDDIFAVNLLTGPQVQRILTQMVKVFTDFPPLGLVLVVMLGIGVAERSGLITAGLKAFVAFLPRRMVTVAIVTAGMLSSIAVDAGYVVLIPLGAVIFYGMGRHPIAGLAAAFAGVSGGFGANLVLTSLDPLLAGFTEPAAHLIDPAYRVDATANWYLMAASVPVIALVGAWVTERIIEPRLGEYRAEADIGDDHGELKAVEKKGLVVAAVLVAVLCLLFAIFALPSVGVLRAADGKLTPFFQSIVVMMFFLFLIPGIVYGLVVGTIRSDKDVAKMTAEAMSGLGTYIVLAFAAAQFVAFFGWSNLGTISAIKGAEFLKAIGFTGIPLMVAFIVVASFINILIGSASAKWAIMAPIFVPMLMLMGYSPEVTQAAYRIGDSYTNILTPLMPYFPLVIVFAQKYVKDVGIGTIIAIMLPYAVAFALVRIPMMVIWLLLELPVGPGAPLTYTP